MCIYVRKQADYIFFIQKCKQVLNFMYKAYNMFVLCREVKELAEKFMFKIK